MTILIAGGNSQTNVYNLLIMVKPKVLKNSLLLFLLGLFVILVRFPSLEGVDKDSGAIAYHARQIIQGQPLYTTHHPAHHLPAAFYTYAAILNLLGDHFLSIKAALIFWIWLNAWVVYLIGRKASNTLGGVLASIFFVLTTAFPNLHGDTAEIEQFANLPLTLTIYVAYLLLAERMPAPWYTIVGVLGGISFLYKVTFLHALAAVGISLLVTTILRWDRSAWAALFKAGLYALAGFAAPLAMVAAYFAAIGAWPGLMLVFQLGTQYVGRNAEAAAYSIILFPLFLMAYANLALTILGVTGSVRNIWKFKEAIKLEQATGQMRLMLAIWLFMSIIVAGISRFPFVYYGLLVVPALSLLAGTEIGQVWEMSRRSQGEHSMVWIAIIFIIAILFNGWFVSRQYFGSYIQFRLGNISKEIFLLAGPTNGAAQLESMAVARYIQQNSTPDDFIFVWSDDIQIYYLANRRTPAYLLWPQYLDKRTISDALAKRPLYVIVAQKLVFNIPTDFILQEISSNFTLKTTINGLQIFRRNPP